MGKREEDHEMSPGRLGAKLLCVALVACIMMPVGRELYPYVAGVIDSLKFDTAEAVVSATLGFAVYAAMFG